MISKNNHTLSIFPLRDTRVRPDVISLRRFVWSAVGGVIMTVGGVILSPVGSFFGGWVALLARLLCFWLALLPFWWVSGWLFGPEWSGYSALVANALAWALIFYAGATIIARLRGGTQPHDRGTA
jgi:hypothetical protein